MQKMIILSNSYYFYINFFSFLIFSWTFFLHFFVKENLIEKEFIIYFSILGKYVCTCLFLIYFHDMILWLYNSGYLMTNFEIEKQILTFKTDILKLQHQNDVSDLLGKIKQLELQKKSLMKYQFLQDLELSAQIERFRISLDSINENFYRNLRELLKKN